MATQRVEAEEKKPKGQLQAMDADIETTHVGLLNGFKAISQHTK
jgi:ATP adenylyltransferase/5',5'''-P-1,P-4-tetraphosphate phosphorylase II